MNSKAKENIYFVQGLYFLVTGLWPIFDSKSFQKVTGRKKDIWLVKMVGLLAASVGWTLIRHRKENSAALETIRRTSTFSFGIIDFYYSLKRRISLIYFADGILQSIFLCFKAKALQGRRLPSSFPVHSPGDAVSSDEPKKRLPKFRRR